LLMILLLVEMMNQSLGTCPNFGVHFKSLSVLRSLKGSFQLIGWIHNQQYDNDYELFPACVSIRRTGLKRGYVLAENADAPPLTGTEEIAAMETHITPMTAENRNDA